MANCPSKSYTVTDLPALAAKIEAAGGPRIDLAMPTGSASSHGVTLAWTIAGGSIVVSCLAKPFYVTCAEIEQHLDALFA